MASSFSENKRVQIIKKSGGGGAVYGLGFVGALFYYMQHAHTFVDVIFGIFKSCVWPAFLIYKLQEFLKM